MINSTVLENSGVGAKMTTHPYLQTVAAHLIMTLQGRQTEFESGGRGETSTYIIKLGSQKMPPTMIGRRRNFFNLKPLKTPYNDILAKKCLPPLHYTSFL